MKAVLPFLPSTEIVTVNYYVQNRDKVNICEICLSKFLCRTAKSWTHLTLDTEKTGRKDRREKMFHIDDSPTGQETSINYERLD